MKQPNFSITHASRDEGVCICTCTAEALHNIVWNKM